MAYDDIEGIDPEYSQQMQDAYNGDDSTLSRQGITAPPVGERAVMRSTLPPSLSHTDQAFTDDSGAYHPSMQVDTIGDSYGNPYEKTIDTNQRPMETIDDKLQRAGAPTKGFKSPFEFKVALIKGLREVAQERGMDLESPEGKQWYANNINHGLKNEMPSYMALPPDPKKWVKVGDSMFNTETKEFANPPDDLADLFKKHADIHGSLSDIASNNADLKENGIQPISIPAPSLAFNPKDQSNASDGQAPEPLPVQEPQVQDKPGESSNDDPMASIAAMAPDARDRILNKHKELAKEFQAYQKRQDAIESDMTPEAKTIAARLKILTGQEPAGVGNAAVSLRKEISNEAARIMKEEGITPEQLALNKARYQGSSAEVKKLMTMRGPQIAMSMKADKAIDYAVELSKKLDRSGSAMWNRAVQASQQELTDNPDLASLNAAITTAVNEYARATSGNGQVTDESKKKAYDILNKAQGQKSFEAVGKTLHREVGIANKSWEEGISNAEKGINPNVKSSIHDKALDWARANPKDERSKKILKLHGL